MNRFLLPLAIFIVLLAFLAVGLGLNPREIPSPLVGKPAPDFSVPQLGEPVKSFAPKDMLGKVWLFNVWASWCVSCRQEHPVIVDTVKRHGITVVGLNYKDQRDDGLRWLRQFGDPYLLSAFDADGRVGMDYGVYGVPETYLIDKAGIIRYKHVGPITQEAMQEKILPLMQELAQ